MDTKSFADTPEEDAKTGQTLARTIIYLSVHNNQPYEPLSQLSINFSAPLNFSLH